MKNNLLTKYSTLMDNEVPLAEYPRPQLKRDSYLCLNGKWQFEASNDSIFPKCLSKELIVPFCPESILSKVSIEPFMFKYFFYKRNFVISKTFLKEITFLHIDAIDQVCDVYINNHFVGRNKGGYLPAIFDISQYITIGENEISIRAIDSIDYSFPTGKQRKKRGGIWYTPVSGIWQTVWVESVSNDYIKGIKLTPDIDENTILIEIESDSTSFDIEIKSNDEVIFQGEITNREQIKINNQHLWSPDDPFLYKIVLKTKCDCVDSYFAMRKFSIENKAFYLNNKKIFINGVLDQGYYSDGIYTPATYEAYKDDILCMKKLGFNSLRKHIKIEPMMYYYYCDTLGMIVLQDMVNVGKYSFLKDTIIPFLGFRNNIPYINVTNKQKEMFINHSSQIVQYLYNVPSILYYTIFNEGWGQFNGDLLYKTLKSIDKTRVFDSTSGWFKENLSDVDSKHIYFKPIKLKKSNKPIIVSEFGGYSFKYNDHCFNLSKTFGYKKFFDKDEFIKSIYNLYTKEVLQNISNGLAGAIYTQLSDVEDETNGLLTYDRCILKVDQIDFYKLMKKIEDEGSK